MATSTNKLWRSRHGYNYGTQLSQSFRRFYRTPIFFSQYYGPTEPELYDRYIDSYIGATSSTREELT